jgi:arginine/serine-rich splicing factor 2
MERRERKDPPNVENMFTLKVDNIGFRTTVELLRDEFKEFGEIGDVYIPRNFRTNDPKGYAFVRFVDQRDGEEAMRSMDGKEIDGRAVSINEAKERR